MNTNSNNTIFLRVLLPKTRTIASLVRAPRRSGTPYFTFHQKSEIYTFDHGRPMNEVNINTSKLHLTLTLMHLFDTKYQWSFFVKKHLLLIFEGTRRTSDFGPIVEHRVVQYCTQLLVHSKAVSLPIYNRVHLPVLYTNSIYWISTIAKTTMTRSTWRKNI